LSGQLITCSWVLLGSGDSEQRAQPPVPLNRGRAVRSAAHQAKAVGFNCTQEVMGWGSGPKTGPQMGAVM
jgi:hypothetical protein